GTDGEVGLGRKGGGDGDDGSMRDSGGGPGLSVGGVNVGGLESGVGSGLGSGSGIVRAEPGLVPYMVELMREVVSQQRVLVEDRTTLMQALRGELDGRQRLLLEQEAALRFREEAVRKEEQEERETRQRWRQEEEQCLHREQENLAEAESEAGAESEPENETEEEG
ncbi:unnamed protein product, partial [Discosporangium mesarthrocarpum]